MKRLRRWWCEHFHSTNMVLVQLGRHGEPSLYECPTCWQRFRWPA